ncbi:MAG: hypothetical protein WEB06_09970 [Actinomycetota bacterium]
MKSRVWRSLSLCAVLAFAGSSPSAGASTSPLDREVLDRIAFSSSRTGTAQIYVMNEDGSGQTRLTDSAPFDDMQPAWSPDGTRVAFTRGIVYQSANLVASRIVVMDAGGGNEVVVADEPGVNVRPAWSPDGKRLLYGHGINPSPLDVWVMNADGSDKHAVTTSGDAYPAAWSPDGSQIVFGTQALDIWVMDDDGANQTRLTTTADNYTPNWAPSDRIVFTSTRDGGGRQVYSMEPDGTDQTRLVEDGAENKFPAWSPDGSRIAYSRSTIPCVGAACNLIGGYEIYVMNADGSSQTRITNTNPPGREFGESYPAYAPRTGGLLTGRHAKTSTLAAVGLGLAATGWDPGPSALLGTALVVGGFGLRRSGLSKRARNVPNIRA